MLEAYDGLNHAECTGLVLQVRLPMLVRGHAILTRVFQDIMSMRVPNLYKLQLGLPISVDESACKSYFDCKVRKLFVYLPKAVQAPVEEEIEVFEAAPV